MAGEQYATGPMGVAPLASALNQLSGVDVVGSDDGDEQGDPYVSFRIGDAWKDLTDFAHVLTGLLKSSPQLSGIAYSLSIEWRNDWDGPLGYLRVSRQHIPAMAEIISSIADDE